MTGCVCPRHAPPFRTQLDREVIEDIRLAFNQGQPLGGERFYAKIEQMTGMRREAKPHGRPRVDMAQNTLS
jgi:putative transposase